MAVTISATFKRDERDNNGLTAIEQQLIDKPLERHLIVALVETKRVVRDVADDTCTPQVRLVMIEPMTTPDRREAAQALLDEAQKDRLGRGAQMSLFDASAGSEG